MLSPVYLFTGPEIGERNEAIDSLKTTLKKKYGDLDVYSYYASESPASEYLSVLQNESLFSSSTCVVVKNADSIKKKDEVDMILSWIKNATSESNVLVLTADSISIDSKIDKAVPSENKKVFWEMFENRKIPWILNYFSKNGYSISEDAASLILDMIENNTETIKSECSRFFLIFPKGYSVSQDDVESILSHSREENAFSLFEAMTQDKDSSQVRLQKSLEILQKIRLSKDSHGVMIIAALTSCFRKLSLWINLKSENKIDDFNLKINGFSSKKMKEQYARASRLWTQGQTTAILADLASTDMKIRYTGSLLEDIFLQELLYEIIIKKGASSSKYEFDLS